MLVTTVHVFRAFWLVLFSVYLVYPEKIPELNDIQKSVIAAHKATAIELNDGGHKLAVQSLDLLPSDKFCPEHFKCWSGEIDGDVHESRHLFLNRTNKLADIIVSLEQEHTFVWIGCEGNMVELPLSFIHDSDIKIYTHPAYEQLLEKCARKLFLSVRKVSWIKHHQNSKHQLNVYLVTSLHTNPQSTDSKEFVEQFHRELKDGRNKSLYLESPLPAPPLTQDVSNFRNRRSAEAEQKQTCDRYATVLDISALETYIKEKTNDDDAKVILFGIQNLYYCAGYCNSIQLFTDKANAPLKEQPSHDEYWTTLNTLKAEGVIYDGPKASCFGYNYTPLEIVYMLSTGPSMEFIYSPKQCACV